MDHPSVIAGLITEDPDIINSTDAAIVEAVLAGDHRLVNILLEQSRKIKELFDKLASHEYYKDRTGEELLELAKQADPTATEKNPYAFLGFIAKLMKPKPTPDIIIWEDGDRVNAVLSKYLEYKPKAQSARRSLDKGEAEGEEVGGVNLHKVAKLDPEIGRYKRLEQLENDIETVEEGLGIIGGPAASVADLSESLLKPGATWIKRSDHYALMKVTDAQSLHEYGKDTSWCTGRHVSTAQSYLDSGNGAVYIIWKQEKEGAPWTKVVQYQPDFSQFMNTRDRPHTPDAEMKELVQPTISDLKKDPQRVVGFAQKYHQGGWTEMEPQILKYPKTAAQYAIHVKKGRWHEAEPAIFKSPAAAIDYCGNLIRSYKLNQEEAVKVLEPLMPQIKKNPKLAVDYAEKILKKRWEEVEDVIIKDESQAIRYYNNFRTLFPGMWDRLTDKMKTTKNAWAASKFATEIARTEVPELEPAILRKIDAAISYHDAVKQGQEWQPLKELIIEKGRPDHVRKYAEATRTRFEDGEPLLLQSPVEATKYHSTFKREFPHGRWAPLEETIVQAENPQAAYDYTLRTEGWPRGEDILALDPELAVQYASKIGRRFPAGDRAFLADTKRAMKYLAAIRGEEGYRTRNVDQWPELEERIKDDASLSMEYAHLIGHRFKPAEHAIVNDPMAAQKYMEDFREDFADGWPEVVPLANTHPAVAGMYAAVTGRRLPEFEKKFKGSKLMKMYAMGLARSSRKRADEAESAGMPF
jgi:hypothetical protein